MLAIRPATTADVEIITGHRRSMFADMGHRDTEALDAMAQAFLPWVRERMQAGDYLAWFAVAEDGSVAAGVGLWLMDWPPHMVGTGSRRGNILNVYTEREFRRQRLARRLTETAMEWCRGNGVSTVILHASDEGRAIYESLGFAPTNEMRILLSK
jgi:GNAT superfamily N-acetyltransferase